MPNLPIDPYNLDYIILYIAVAVIIFIIKMIYQDLSKGRQQKIKQNKFINFLRFNKSINYHIERYEKRGFFNRPWSIFYLYIGMALAFIISFLSLIIIAYLYGKKMTDAIAIISIFLFTIIPLLIPLILFVFIKKYIDFKEDFEKPYKILKSLTIIFNGCLNVGNWLIGKSKYSKIDDDAFLDRYISYANMLTVVNFYLAFSYPIISVSIVGHMSQILDQGTHTQMLFMIASMLFLSTPVGVFIQNQKYKRHLKNVLNSKGQKLFPYLHVRTKENIQIDGTIMDIFDDKFLILEDNGVKKVILWDSVCTLEISEGEAVDTLHQKKLQDYFG